MHLAVYRNCKHARAVIHAHPPHAIAWSIVNPDAKFMPTESLPEVILGIGKIPQVPYGRPGTPALGEQMQAFLKNDFRAMILARHGAIAYGESLMEALNGIERLEHAAYVLHAARGFGTPQTLPRDELAWLMEKRRKNGKKSL
jgi:L-fuculose-phosphate aldolase